MVNPKRMIPHSLSFDDYNYNIMVPKKHDILRKELLATYNKSTLIPSPLFIVDHFGHIP